MLDAFAGQRFVSTGGSDTSKGTFDQPWRTIQHAANFLLPNDTVFIRGGTYSEQVIVNVSGTNGSAYISFMPFANEEVVISGVAATSPDMFTIESQSYIRVIGLKFRDLRIPDTTDVNKGGSAIRVTGSSHNITLARNTISNISGVLPQGIAVYGYDSAALVRNVRIVGNTIYSFLTDTVNGSYGGSGVRISGACDSILIRLNTIHDMRAVYDSLGGAMAITVYGVNAGFPSRRILIDGNTVYDCEASRSEAITLSGNVEDFSVLYNTVYQINNIGIATGGGYFVCPDSALDFPRRGKIKWNSVYSCRTRLEDGYAAGIYVDGSRNVVIEGNRSSSNDIGIGVNAEQVGRICDSIVVRSNFMWGNDRAGLAIGGYGIGFRAGELDTSGIVQHCRFLNNTTFRNNRRGVGQGELSLEDSLFNSDIRNNIFYAGDDTLVFSTADVELQNIRLDYNQWFTPLGAGSSVFRMNGFEGPDFSSFAEYRTATRLDSNSLFASPQFVDSSASTPNLHLRAVSLAINRGDPNFIAAADELDIDEEQRVVSSRVDIGADEFSGSVRVEGQEIIGDTFLLNQNYPNPFNPQTNIQLSIPFRTHAKLIVFDIVGRKVATLVDAVLESGTHHVQFDATNLASGVYYYQLRAGNFIQSKPMVVIR